MKIIAQSTVSTSPSYLHLGYVSGGILRADRPYDGLAVGLALLGLLLLAKLRAVTTAGKTSTHVVLRGWPGCMIGATVILAGLMLLWLGPKTRMPQIYTIKQMMEAVQRIERTLQRSGPAPVSEAAVRADLAGLDDEWQRPLRITCVRQSPPVYEVRSAGRDGLFNTQDDRVQRTHPTAATAPASRPST